MTGVRHRIAPVAALCIAMLALMVRPPARALPLAQLRPGPHNAITDVAGILVGHYTNATAPALTGTTAVLTPDGATGGVDVRGGGPGTVETDALAPGTLIDRVDGIVLSGGSAYGLAARPGVVRCIQEGGRGFDFTGSRTPIVPGAIIFDLGRGGEFTARPDADYGYKACKAASASTPAQGTVGAGTGASSGGVKGGFGTASVDLGNGVIVAAVAVVNSVGATFRPVTCELYMAYLELGDEFGAYKAPPGGCDGGGGGGAALRLPTLREAQPLNTTIGIVATNVTLTKEQARAMATAAHDGMARAIRPSHTLLDGDTIFSLSTRKLTVACVQKDSGATVESGVLGEVYQAAADAFSRAVDNAILRATTAGGITSYCDTYAEACAALPAQNNTASTSTCGAPAPPTEVPPLPATGTSSAPGLAITLLSAAAAATLFLRRREAA